MPDALIGQKNRRITFILPGETIASGEATPTETVLATVWAEMEGRSGFNRDELLAEADYRFTIWYRPDVTTRHRIGLSGTARRFKIVVPPLDPTGLKKEMVVLAKEILG
jgi:SPP1 family predicted phage head-tail adaptor